ncbi:MAG: endonuclease NucS [Methanobrevibacter sp.]|uniref:endonuclease NucS n=1 Tax=Methanobrevibacter sp. TaxID=66852 RepID=UPI0026DFB08A|nr:endonuclease NucS [Methanobrevibacter sp.]MDO5848958.1 endonuclease NucS [Methanobrevibacter sp.]
MKYKILENPNHESAYELVSEALRKKATVYIFASCKIEYEGRALSQLNWGERIILIKPDGSFLVHQDKKVEPVNWQPPKSKARTYLKDKTLFLESHRRTPKELLTVELGKIHIINYTNVEDFEELEQAGYEKDMGDMIMKRPHIIEEGFKPTAREYSVEHGFIDILGKDKNNNLMVLELKCRKAGVSAVKQLKRYLTDFEDDEDSLTNHKTKEIRGILVAPSIDEDAKELIEEEGIEFISMEAPKELKRDKKVTLDIF